MAKEFDLVLFGATGFTGGLTAHYLARRAAAESLHWAIAGRDADRLAALAAKLGKGAEPPATLAASVDDPSSLVALAEKTRVLATTVGPYERYGDPVVAAAVEGGCDYLDITGEPAFVERTLERHDAAARERGLRIVSCCGFDSVPHDLGALLAVRALGADRRIELAGFVRGQGTFSGGTWHSAVEAMGKMGVWEPRRSKHSKGTSGDGRVARLAQRQLYRERRLGVWAVALPTIDPLVVLRSARALADYGPDFRYGHYVAVRSLPRVVMGAAFIGGVFALAQLPPTRRLLLTLRGPGEGPDAEQRARGRFRVVLLGRSGEKEARVEVAGGDPGYGETAKMLAEASLAVVRDRERLPERAGVLTPAVALGEVLVERLRAAGMEFTVEANHLEHES